jgi:hypothetical protein
MQRLLVQRLLDKVNKPAVVLIALVVLISVDGFAYFYPNRNFERGPIIGPIIVEEERRLPRAEGAAAGTPKEDAAPEAGRGGAVSSKASGEVGLPVGTSAVSPTVPAAPQGTAPPFTATPTATASSTATPTATASSTATPTATASSTATPTATASSTAAATAPPATVPPATATDAPTLEMSIEEGQATPDASQIDSPQLPSTPTPQDVRPRP